MPASSHCQTSPPTFETKLHPAQIAAVALGGAIGALLRFAVNAAFNHPADTFPWHTLLENVSGSLLLGFFLGLFLHAERRTPRPRIDLRPFLCTGILGSFTTFSNFAIEVVGLSHANLITAWAYVATSLALGLSAAWLGLWLAEQITRRRGHATHREAQL